MPTTRHSRHGSLQYWPRKRASRQHARVRSFKTKKPGLTGFGGYKAGMTHVILTDNSKNAPTKGQEITIPVTIIECPPLTIAGVRLYTQAKKGYGEAAATEVRKKAGKDIERTTTWKPTGSLDKIKPEDYTRATILIHSQPSKTGIGQKKPQVFELGFNGSVEEAIAFAKENDEVTVDKIFQPGQFVDAHAVTTGRGTQGVVKRFGVSLRSHKSEKSARKAVIGGEGYGKVGYTAPMAGKMGYHLRTEHNKKVINIVQPEEVKVSGGLVGYGDIKNPALLIKGSIPGPKKRFITLLHATRPDPKKSEQAADVTHIATRSQQGNQ